MEYDVATSVQIFGKNVDYLKGKIEIKTPIPMVSRFLDIPCSLLKPNNKVVLIIAIILIKRSFFVRISHTIHFYSLAYQNIF